MDKNNRSLIDSRYSYINGEKNEKEIKEIEKKYLKNSLLISCSNVNYQFFKEEELKLWLNKNKSLYWTLSGGYVKSLIGFNYFDVYDAFNENESVYDIIYIAALFENQIVGIIKNYYVKGKLVMEYIDVSLKNKNKKIGTELVRKMTQYFKDEIIKNGIYITAPSLESDKISFQNKIFDIIETETNGKGKIFSFL